MDRTAPTSAATAAGPGAWARRRVDLWRFGILVSRWTARDFRSRYGTSALRAVWAVLQPFFFVGVYVVIFGVIFQQSGGDVPFLTYLLGGVVVYRIVVAAISSSSGFVDNLNLMSHASFPRVVIPVSQVLGNLVDVLVTTVGLLVVAVVQGVELHPEVLLVPLVLAGVVLFAMAVCIFLSTAQVFVRDLQFVMTFVAMGLFFASPITYQADQLPQWLAWLDWANPISVFVRALRDVALNGAWPDGWFWAHLVGAGVALVLSVLHLRAVEHRIVDLG